MNTREELRAEVHRMRVSAEAFVRRYAADHAPHIAASRLDGIIGALGDISIDEACDALDKIELEPEPEPEPEPRA